MNWKSSTNDAVRRATGYRLVRDQRGPALPLPDQSNRHLVAPIFIISSVRSGSTLLRSIMGGHSHLYAPHELHLRDLQVDLTTDYVTESMKALGLDKRELEHLLWDCMLAREVAKAGKKHLLNKTPHDVFMWRRIEGCWPDARFVFLQRHPYAVVRSWHAARPQWSLDEAIDSSLKYMEAVEEARTSRPGITVRYEDLTADAEAVCGRVCEYLGIEWEPDMLDYAKNDHDTFRAGFGDWTKKIRSGRVQPAAPLPDPAEIPPRLKDICAAWGYV
ncbi:sulfotransferase family protein [Actinomadura scrupuli]|uniref:sulfotransferase family protein n=1 Tax=Actinomadura scrupuli TaxID=559629 RepID=UPI003D97D4FD